MLVDEIVTADISGCELGPLRQRIGAAHKFVLGTEFTAVAESLGDDYSGLVRVFDRCRLPYRETWFELLQADRPRFMQAGVHIPQFQRKPKRIGFLLSATRADLSAWKTHLFWSIETPGEESSYGTAMSAMLADMSRPLNALANDSELERLTREDDHFGVPSWRSQAATKTHPGWLKANARVRLMMTNHTAIAAPDFHMTLFEHIEPWQHQQAIDALYELSRSDWAGEIPYMLAVVGLLNARNAVETEHVDRKKINRSRAKAGKLPLFEHHVLKIAERQTKRYISAGANSEQEHAARRAHWARGHWKLRRTGLFYWRPHLRGDLNRGMVDKDYEVT
jgi:hypothetical protein